MAAVVKELDVRIGNAGLFDRIVAAKVDALHQSPAQIRQQLIMTAATNIPVTLAMPDRVKVVDAVAEFIANPKTLHLIANSAEAIGTLTAIPGGPWSRITLSASSEE